MTYCEASWCDKHPSNTSCINPSDAKKCKASIADCTAAICGNTIYKEYDNCKALKCKSNADDCTYEICQSDAGKDWDFCKPAYRTAHPSATQSIIPADAVKCKANMDDCTADICGNSVFKDYDTCKEF